MNKHLTPPQETASDQIHSLLDALISVFFNTSPIEGTLASQLFNIIWTKPIGKKLEKWRHLIVKTLANLQIEIESLKKNQALLFTLIQTSRYIPYLSDIKKLDYFANVVRDAASNPRTPVEKYATIIRYIDELLILSIELLLMLIKKESYLINIKSYTELKKLTQMQISDNEFHFLCQELINKGCLRISNDLDDFHDIYSATHIIAGDTNDKKPRIIITDFGKQMAKIVK